MKYKRFITCLLMILLFPFISIVQASAARWSDEYQKIALNPYNEYYFINPLYPPNGYVVPRFSLYDLDHDGLPELFAFNGSPYYGAATCGVFNENGSAIGYAGFTNCELYYYDDPAWPGVFCTDVIIGSSPDTIYYEKHQKEVSSKDGKHGFADEVTKNDVTVRSDLPNGPKHYLSFYTREEINTMGWEAFLQATLGENVPYDTVSTVKTTENENADGNSVIDDTGGQTVVYGENGITDVDDAGGIFGTGNDHEPDNHVIIDPSVPESQPDDAETNLQENGAVAITRLSTFWAILAVVSLLVALTLLLILLIQRRKQSAKKHGRKGSDVINHKNSKLPAYSDTRCCICGQRLDEQYKVFLRDEDGREARIDKSCFQKLNAIHKREDAKSIREAQRFFRSCYDMTDPVIKEHLKRISESVGRS